MLAHPPLSGSQGELAIGRYELQGAVLFQMRLNQPETRQLQAHELLRTLRSALATLRQIILKATPEEDKTIPVELTTPNGAKRRFQHLLEMAQWAAANALKGVNNEWMNNGEAVS
jgi:hypothetical protein